MPDPVPIARSEPGQPDKNTLIPRFYVLVVDENDQPLDGKYALYQNRVQSVESFMNSGQAYLYNVDKTKPFGISVPGRVCAIVEGAALAVDDDTQYGGVFFDWKQADDDKTADAFFREYAAERAGDRWGPSTFWQHEHLSRRQFRVRKKYLDGFPSLLVKLQAVPLRIRTGPMVRYTDHQQAVVWVELETPGLVRVLYRKHGTSTPSERHASTLRAGGRHFAAVVLDGLEEHADYDYTLELAPQPMVMKIPVTESDFEREKSFAAKLPAATVEHTRVQLRTRSFSGTDEWLTFRTLKQRYTDRFVFAHGSCRKYPGDTDPRGGAPGQDALDQFARNWLAQKSRDDWPAFLFLGGDQIYGDDIGDKTGLAMRWQRYSSQLAGPPDDGIVGGAWAGRFADRFINFAPQAVAADVKPLQQKLINLHKQYEAWQKRVPVEFGRDEGLALIAKMRAVQREIDDWGVVVEDAGYVMRESKSRPMRFKYRVTNNHLWAIPSDPKDVPEIGAAGVYKRRPDSDDPPRARHPAAGEERAMHAADFAEYSYLYERAFNTADAARALAQMPTYMLFDDHEITDDWNFDKTWVDIILDQRDMYHYWPKTIADGLSAYWLYQGWCNLRPDTWAGDPRTKILLDAQKSGHDALPELRRLMHDKVVKNAGHPNWTHDEVMFNYQLPMSEPTFLVPDLRTRRLLEPNHDKSQTLDDTQMGWLKKQLKAAEGHAAFVVFSTPYFLPRAVSFAMRHPLFSDALAHLGPEHIFWDLMQDDRFEEAMRRDSDMEHMVVDKTWDDFRKLVDDLQNSVTHLKTIVMLSGDVHFSYGMLGRAPADERLRDGMPDWHAYPEMLQLVSSAFRNKPSDKKRGQLVWFSENVFAKIHEVRGLRLHPIAFARGAPHDDERPMFLTENSTAIVDVRMTEDLSDNGGIEVRQSHLTDGLSATDRPLLFYRSNDKTG
jgi:hypothetical protein